MIIRVDDQSIQVIRNKYGCFIKIDCYPDVNSNEPIEDDMSCIMLDFAQGEQVAGVLAASLGDVALGI